MRWRTTMMSGLFLATACLGACQHSSKTAMVWQDPVYRDLEYKQIMVIAFMDQSARVEVEEFVARKLNSIRLHATPSSNVISSLDQMDFMQFANFAKADKIDAVITIVPFADEAVVSETDWTVDSDMDLRGFIDDGRETVAVVGDYGIEVIIWNTKDWRPFWAGRSEVFAEAAETTDVADFVAGSIRQNDAL